MSNKVLHILPTLKKDGAESQLLTLVEGQQLQDMIPVVLTFDLYKKGSSVEEELIELGVEILSSKRNIFSILNIIYKEVNTNKYLAVHSHLPKADIAVGIVKLIFDVNHVISIHAQYGTRQEESKIKYFFLFPIWKFFVNRASSIISISEKVKSWLIRNKIKNDINVVYYAVGNHLSSHKPSNSNIIGMAARYLPWKGWDNLLEVASKLSEQNFDFQLHLAGSDDIGYKKDLKIKVKEKGLKELVFIHDEFESIYDFFDLIDVFVFLSESEGFGLVVLEAMSYGLPVICSDIQPINEFVDRETGVLIDRDNTDQVSEKLIELLLNEDKRMSMSRNQLNKVKDEFSIEKMVQKVKELYYSP